MNRARRKSCSKYIGERCLVGSRPSGGLTKQGGKWGEALSLGAGAEANERGGVGFCAVESDGFQEFDFVGHDASVRRIAYAEPPSTVHADAGQQATQQMFDARCILAIACNQDAADAAASWPTNNHVAHRP